MFKKCLEAIKRFFGYKPVVTKINVPKETVVQEQAVTFPYLINDPTTPELVKNIKLPNHPKRLDFGIRGYNRDPVKTGTPQHQAANCYVTLANCINYMQRTLSRFQPALRRWAATQKLDVVPRAGKMLNAYYDRKGLKFFWEKDAQTKRIIYTADSSDIVAHELGHAYLDAMRPDFWSVQALEIWSFHEAFADVTAMLSLMQHDEVIHKALEETKGDLKKPNVISRLAEEMGDIIYRLTQGRQGHKPGALRNATNNFKYVDPRKLPAHAPDNKLAAECHSFGRVFLGAWYDIFVGIYEQELSRQGPLMAVKTARDIAGKYFLKAIPKTPRSAKYFNAAARTMLAIDRADGGTYQNLMAKAFHHRKIILPRVKMLSNTTWNDLRDKVQRNDEIFKKKDSMIVRLSREGTMKIKDDAQISALSGKYDLSNLNVEVPMDSYYEFVDGILVDEIVPETTEIYESAKMCVLSIAQNGDIGDGPDTMWSIEDGKLIRTYIQ